MRLAEGIHVVGSGAMGLSHPLDCHIYLIDTGDGLALIDAGAGYGVRDVLANVEREGLRPRDIRWLLLTHGHLDHANGAAELREGLGLQVLASSLDARLIEAGTPEELGLARPPQFRSYPVDFVQRHCPIDRRLMHADVVGLGRLSIEVILVPGHTPGSVCYLMEIHGRRVAFVGDILFYNGVLGLLNTPLSDLGAYREFLPRLANRSIDALLPGHMLFVLSRGQAHIDKALLALQRSMLPPCVSELMV
mgnify:CR=1 FL=1